MLLLKRPSDERIRRFLSQVEGSPFSYVAVGATRGASPKGYTVDHNRICLGSGAVVFARAVAAIRRWEMFRLGWVRLCWPETPITEGSTVAIVSQQWGFWTLNASRVIYRIEEEGPPRRFGFAYGTLGDHVESGEERFLVEWQRDDDAVWYDLLAFSRPNHWLVAGARPLARGLQRRFAADSLRAMRLAVEQDAPLTLTP